MNIKQSFRRLNNSISSDLDKYYPRPYMFLFVIGISFVITLIPNNSFADTRACSSACLESVAQKYLLALQTHSPEKLPQLAPIEYTENGIRLSIGLALWGTVSKVEEPMFILADPITQSVAVWTVIEEGKGRQAMLAAYIKTSDQKITELDTVVVRKSAQFNPAGWMQDTDIPGDDLLISERSTREEMKEIADAYFTAVTSHGNGPFPQFDQACNRIENGHQSTNNSVPLGEDTPLRVHIASLGCEAQFKAGALTFIDHARHIKYVAIDETKGLILAQLVFDHDGFATQKEKVADKGKKPRELMVPFPSPLSLVVHELFKIKMGKILQIRAAITDVPYGMEPH